METLAGRYELGDALGQGRSTVFRAVDSRLRRDVAIKRVQLLAGQEDAHQVRTRALREAQASARLNNPAVVTVYDVVEEEGAIWLVMELVAGPSLSQIVSDEGPLPAPRAAAIALGVLTALEAAHLVGVVHRDVKPANVLVTEGDRAKLTDFGVATIRDESRVTATGLIVGSPSYMAPEQATGGEITASTDLWALGAMLYFSVEGTPPFQAGSALATASAVVHGEPRPQQNRGELTPVIDRLLVKDPAARARAGEIRAALTRIARDERRRRRPRRDPSAGATQLMPVTPQAFTPAASSTPSSPASAAVPPPAAAPPPTPTPKAPGPAPMPAPVVESAPATSDPAPESGPAERKSDPMPEPGSSGRESGSVPDPGPSTAESGPSGESEPGAPESDPAPEPEPAPTPVEAATEPVPGVTPETDPATEVEPSVPEPDLATEVEPSVPGPDSATELEPSMREPGFGSEPEPAPTLVDPAATSAPTAVSAPVSEPPDQPASPPEPVTGAEPTSDPDPSPAATSGVGQTSAAAGSAEPVTTPGPRPVTESTGGPAAPPRAPAGREAHDPAAGVLTPERRRLFLVAAGVVALLLAAVVIPSLGNDDQAGRDPTPTTAEPAPANESPPPDETTVPETTETTEASTTTTTEPTGALPEGWAPYADPQGTYTIGLPPGWRVQPTSQPTRIDLVDPATDSLLRIEWVEPPNGDPVGAWESSVAGFAANNAGYEQIRIEPVSYRDYDAAMWEFRHGSGPVMHTGNLGFVTNGRGYALMLRTPEDRWAASQPLFEQFKQAFQPT